MMYSKHIKRVFDFVLALTALTLLSPLLVALALLIDWKLGRPVIFQQDRPGKNEKIFKLYKFRSMTDERDKNGELLPDIQRLTAFGKKLRSTSLDELPELINILKGDMSFVGPRPLLVQYLPLYSKEHSHRHDVRPGLTGLAQVSGRNGISWEERFEYDLNYIRNITFLNDLKIIIMTMKKVFKREGIEAGMGVTMEIFRGYDKEKKS